MDNRRNTTRGRWKDAGQTSTASAVVHCRLALDMAQRLQAHQGVPSAIAGLKDTMKDERSGRLIVKILEFKRNVIRYFFQPLSR